MKTKLIIITLFIPLVFLCVHNSFADAINTTPLPVGSGARALGQGGAFIAVADDATAASWNPGGLTQLERPEISLVGSFLYSELDFDPGGTGFQMNDEEVPRGDLNYASVAYPFKVFGKNLTAALNYQQKYDFHMKMDLKKTDLSSLINGDLKTKGGIDALTPAIALQVTPKLSLGIAVNVYTDEHFGNYAWRSTYHVSNKTISTGAISTYSEEDTFKNFQAVNVTTGMLLDVWEKEDKRLTFGAVFHSPYTADVDLIRDSNSDGTPNHERHHYNVDYPTSFGAGFGFRYNDALSFSVDATWTDWSAFQQEDEHGKKTRPLGSDTPSNRRIDDTYAIRYGTEYLIFKEKTIVPIRGGLFYDPRPSLDNPTDVYGFSVGSGITFKRFNIDGAYQFRRANNVDGEDFGGINGTHFGLNEHLFLASVIVYF